MRRALVVLGLLMVAQEAHAKEDRVTVRGLGPDLKLTGWQAQWPAEGEIVKPLLPRPGGGMLALVEPPVPKALTLVSWSKEGKVLAQTTLPLTDEVVAAKIFGSKLIVASATKVIEVDETDFRKIRHAAVTESPAEFVIYEASPMGLWVVTAEAVTHHYLDGRPPLEASTRRRKQSAIFHDSGESALVGRLPAGEGWSHRKRSWRTAGPGTVRGEVSIRQRNRILRQSLARGCSAARS